jgi:hypothetical protein
MQCGGVQWNWGNSSNERTKLWDTWTCPIVGSTPPTHVSHTYKVMITEDLRILFSSWYIYIYFVLFIKYSSPCSETPAVGLLAKSVQPIPSHLTSVISVLILSSRTSTSYKWALFLTFYSRRSGHLISPRAEHVTHLILGHVTNCNHTQAYATCGPWIVLLWAANQLCITAT